MSLLLIVSRSLIVLVFLLLTQNNEMPFGKDYVRWIDIYISMLWRLNMKWLHESSAVYQIYFDDRICREGTRENLKLHTYHISFRWCEWLVVKLFPWRRFSHYSEKWSTLKYIFGWRYRSISTIALSLNCK